MRYVLPLLVSTIAWGLAPPNPPPCYDCGPFFTEYYTSGFCRQWYPPSDVPQPAGFCVKWADLKPDALGTIADLWFQPQMTWAEKTALYKRQVMRVLDGDERAAWQKLLEHLPKPAYVVKGTTFQPTYLVGSNGKRATKSNGQIKGQTGCYGSLWNSGGYLAITDTKPYSVALCVRR